MGLRRMKRLKFGEGKWKLMSEFLRARAICFFPLAFPQRGWIFYDFDFPRLLCVASMRHDETDTKKLLKLFNLFFPRIINIWTQTNNWTAAKPRQWYADPTKLSSTFFLFFYFVGPQVFLAFIICMKCCLIMFNTNVKLYIVWDYGAFWVKPRVENFFGIFFCFTVMVKSFLNCRRSR